MTTKADALRLTISSVEIENLSVSGTLFGVSPILAAARNGPGTGLIRNLQGRLAWQAPGSSTFGDPIDVPADGQYLLCDGEDRDKWVRVQVYTDFLLSNGEQTEVRLTDLFGGISYADVTAAQASAGDVATWSISMDNVGSVILSDLRVWIDAAVADVEISDDDSTWVSPTSESAALVFPDLAPSASDTLYFRRTISASEPYDPAVLDLIHFAFNGL